MRFRSIPDLLKDDVMRKTVILALTIFTAAFNAYAAAPNLLTYQGRLKESGLAVNGNKSVEILLCDAETGGTCTTTGAQGTAVTNGLFRSTFTVPAAADITAGNWYLEIHVGGTTLLPREKLTGNAYSLYASTAAYAAGVAPLSITNASIANGTITDAKLAAITASGKVANSATTATNANTPNTIVQRDGSGNFSANTITGNVVGSVTGNAATATSATTAGTATNFTGNLTGDVTGSQAATVVASVGGQTAANIAAGAILASNASSNNTANTIIRRDASGNFSANNFTGNVTGNITGGITGNVTGAASLNVLKTGDTMVGNLNMGGYNITNVATLNTVTLNATTLNATVMSMSGNIDMGNWDITRVRTLNVNSGSAAAPSLTFVGGTTTGIYSPAVNTIGFATAGTQRMTIGPTGAVTLNGGGLSVTGGASVDTLTAGSTLVLPATAAGTPSLTFAGNLTTGINATANTLGFNTSGASRMSIDAAGGVTVTSMTISGPATIAYRPVIDNPASMINVTSGMFGKTLLVLGGTTVVLPVGATTGAWLTIVKMGAGAVIIKTYYDEGHIGDSTTVTGTSNWATITLEAVSGDQWVVLGYGGSWGGI